MTGVVNIQVDGKAAEVAVERSTSALATLFGPAAVELGRAWGERAAFYRLQQSMKLHDKTVALRERYPVPLDAIRSIPDSEGFRALEAASLEDEPVIQDMWANLLRNATDKRTNVTVEKAFVEFLEGLSGPEAILLHALQESSRIEDRREAAAQSIKERYLSASKAAKDCNGPKIENNLTEELDALAKQALDSTSKAFEDQWRLFPLDVRDFAIRNAVRVGFLSPPKPNINFRPHIQGTSISTKTSINVPRNIDVVTPRELEQAIDRLLQVVGRLSELEIPDMANATPVHANSKLYKLASYYPEMLLRMTPLASRLLAACSPPSTS